jgi:pimeloyl-ACP methyl ester carboxylesterase
MAQQEPCLFLWIDELRKIQNSFSIKIYKHVETAFSMKDVIFADVQGNRLLGTLSLPDQAQGIVIASHGFSSSKESSFYIQMQEALNAESIGALRYDYYGHGKLYGHGPGYGVSPDVTLTKTVASLEAALAFVRSQGNYSIGLLGSSFGGLVSLVVAARHSDLAALVLKSPVTEPLGFWRSRIGNERIEEWMREGVLKYGCGVEQYSLGYGFWEDLQQFDTLGEANNVCCPTMIIHGDADSSVPLQQSIDLSAILRTNLKVVAGADHGYSRPEHYAEMKKAILSFFIDTLPRKLFPTTQ